MRKPLLPGRLWRRLREPFPVVGGNAIGSREQRAGFFAAMLRAIEDARATVDVEQYLWDADDIGREFIDALRCAAERGLRVRVLVDASGAAGVVSALRVVDEAGGDVRVFNPLKLPYISRWFHRTHKKIVVCDGWRGFTGGAGFSTHWSSGPRREQPWHDRMYEIHGPVVRQLERVFEVDFERWKRRTPARPGPGKPDAGLELVPTGSADMRVLRGFPDAFDFKQTLLAAIREAKERVWIGTPYFIPPPSLFRALRGAIKRGVDVQLVLPSGNYAHPILWHASRRHYGYFIKRGARIHEYAPVFYHAKLAVVDRTVAIVGSSNLDYWSWDRNAEVDVVATDAATVEQIAREFETDRAKSRVVTLRELGVMGLWSRLTERFAGWIEAWL